MEILKIKGIESKGVSSVGGAILNNSVLKWNLSAFGKLKLAYYKSDKCFKKRCN